MKRVLYPSQVQIGHLVVLLLFFDFFPKFIAREYLSDFLPFNDFIDQKVATAIGDLIFFLLLANIFGKEVKQYFTSPSIFKSLSYGMSLKAVWLGIMVPIGFLSVKFNLEFFYHQWWEFEDIPVFNNLPILLAPGFKWENIVYVFCVVVVTPVIEEMLYRVVGVDVFRRKHSKFKSTLLIAILFSIAHPTYFFFFFFFSLVMSFLIYKTGSVWSAIIAHSVFNILSFIDAYYSGIGSFKPLESVGSLDAWSVQALFIPLALGLVYLFVRNNRKTISSFISDSPAR